LKGKLVWLLLPCLMVIALVMPSCGGNPALEVAKKWDAAMDDASMNGNVDALDEVEDPDVVVHPMGLPDMVGREAHKAIYASEWYVNYQRETMDITGSGDTAAIRYTERWTFSKELPGFPPPTGKELNYEAAVFLRIKDGKVVEVFMIWDTMRFNQGIGIVPETPMPGQTPASITTLETEILVDGLVFGECPRWHNGKLWFSDMHAHQVMTVDLDGKTEKIVEVPNQPAGLGWLPDGRLLVVSQTDKRLLRLDPDGLTEVADLSGLASGTCNDMVVDALGRAYIGNFGLDTDLKVFKVGPAEIIMVTPEGDTRVVATDMIFPNGSVITPDGRTLIVAETANSDLIAFDIDSDGSLSGRRVWAKLESLESNVFPDGICLDAEGAVWLANAAGTEVIRVLEGGEVTHRVKTSNLAFACMLGGPDGRTLFICTAETFDPDEARAKASGRIETVKVDVPGAGLP